jgi:hypothetical protein
LANHEQGQTRFPIVKLISFGAGIPGIENAIERLRRQAEAFRLIHQVEIFGSEDLDEPYFKTFGKVLDQFPQGYGLWSWKPYLVSRELSKLQEGDILIYVDVGTEVNQRGLDKFCKYLDHISINKNLFFSVGLQHRFFTKQSPELLTPENFFRNQVVGGVFMLQACSSSQTLVNKWLELCQLNESELLKDHVGTPEATMPGFVAHRHDQAVLAKVVFDFDIPTLDDGTFFENWSNGRNEPFLALRNKQSRYSWIWAALWLPPALLRVWKLLSVVLTPGSVKRKISVFFQR